MHTQPTLILNQVTAVNGQILKEQVPSDCWVQKPSLPPIELGLKGQAGFEQQQRSGETGHSGQKNSNLRERQAGLSDQKQDVLMEIGEHGRQGEDKCHKTWINKWRLMGFICRDGTPLKVSLLRQEVIQFKGMFGDTSLVEDSLVWRSESQRQKAAEDTWICFPKGLGFRRCSLVYGPPQYIGNR